MIIMDDKEINKDDNRDTAQKDEKQFETNEKKQEQNIDPGNEHNHLEEEQSKTR